MRRGARTTAGGRVTRRGLRRWPLLVAVAVDSLGTGLYLPLSMLYFLRVTDLDLGTIGALVSATTALTLPVPIVVGRLVDRLGPRPVVAGGQALQGVGFLVWLAVSGAASLVGAVLVTTVGLRVYWSSVFTLVADHADAEAAAETAGAAGAERPEAGRAGPPADVGGPDSRDRWFARTGMMREAGMGGGSLLAGALLAADSARVYDGLILASAVTFLAAALLVVFAVPATAHASPPARGRSGYRALFRDRPYLGLIGTNTIFALCSTFLSVSLPVYVVRGLSGPEWLPGPLMALNTLLLATCTAAVNRFVLRRCTRARAMAWAGGLWALWCAASAAAVLVPAAALAPFLVAVMVCYTAAEMTHGPASNELSAQAAPAGSRGTYLAAFQYSFAGANIVAPLLFGVLFSQGRLLPYLAVGLLALLGSALMLRLEPRLPGGGRYARRGVARADGGRAVAAARPEDGA